MNKKRILVAEDEGVTAMNLKSTLSELGYEVSAIVARGEEVIRKAGELLPDLILMDITLDGPMNGIQAAAEINRAHAIPLIYLTAHADDETLDRAKATEPFGFLPKPCSKNTLAATIEVALYKSEADAARRRAEAELQQERAAHEAALRLSEEKFRTVADFTHDWEFWIGPDAAVIYCSPSCARITGHEAAEFIANPTLIRQLVHPDDLAAYDQHRHDALAGNKALGLEYRIISADGSTRWLSHVCQPVCDSQGQFAGNRGSNRDITERKSLEAELTKARDLENLGILAAGIAHDFNNLLQGLLGNISLAQLYIPTSSPAYGYLQEAEQAHAKVRKLTAQLVAFSSGGFMQRVNLQPASLIREEIVAALSNSQVVAEFAIAEDLCQIKVDPGQFQQVIKHLVSNAREAMPEGGVVRVRAETEKLSAAAAKTLALIPGDYLLLSIQDQGCGISPHNLSKIFAPYYSTKERAGQKGMGLGLALSNTIVQKHGGALTVETELGKGSTFYLRIPAVAGDLPKTAEAEQGQGTRILVMDDDLGVVELLSRFLGRSGYRVDSAADGEATIKAYQEAVQAGDHYALVILEEKTRVGLGGKEVLNILRGIDPQIKAIASNGSGNDCLMDNFAAYGFVGAVEKPYRMQEMKEMLDRLL